MRFGCAIDSSIVLMKKHPHIEEMLKTSIMANVDFMIISVFLWTFFVGWTINQLIAWFYQKGLVLLNDCSGQVC